MAGNIKLLGTKTLPLLRNWSGIQTCCLSMKVIKIPLQVPDVCKLLSVTNNSALSMIRAFDQKQNWKEADKLLSNTSYVFNSNRNIMNGKKNKKPKKRKVPRLILIQNPFTWLMTKFDFMVLRHVWDSAFVEREFKHGTKQAISRVTQVISENQLVELNGLLTKPARISLLRELDRNWSEKHRSLLALHRDDIQISSPRKVYFIRIADKKYCDVDMSFLALKWIPIHTFNALLFTEIFARFHREYTPHSIPEWTIAFFKITRFEIIKKEDRELD